MKILNRNIIFGILSVLFLNNIIAANLIIKKGTQRVVIPSENIRGTEYVASSKLAKALGANYFFNPST